MNHIWIIFMSLCTTKPKVFLSLVGNKNFITFFFLIFEHKMRLNLQQHE